MLFKDYSKFGCQCEDCKAGIFLWMASLWLCMNGLHVLIYAYQRYISITFINQAEIAWGDVEFLLTDRDNFRHPNTQAKRRVGEIHSLQVFHCDCIVCWLGSLTTWLESCYGRVPVIVLTFWPAHVYTGKHPSLTLGTVLIRLWSRHRLPTPCLLMKAWRACWARD